MGDYNFWVPQIFLSLTDAIAYTYFVLEIPAGFGPGSRAPLYEQEALIHTTTELPCNPTGAPKPRVRWRAGFTYVTSGGRMKILPNGNLRIYNVSKADAKTYKCEVSNRLGSASKDGRLTVLGTKQFYIDRWDNIFQWILKHNKAPVFSWRINEACIMVKGAVSATPLFCIHLGTWLTKLLRISTQKYLITKKNS